MTGSTLVFVALFVCAALYVLRDFLLMRRALARKKFSVRIEPDDPFILAAAEKARSTLSAFDVLREKYPQYSSLALSPIGPNGEITPALVKSRTQDGYIVCRARNNAVGHAVAEGEEFLCKPEGIVDWIVYESEKKDRIHGGYTLRAVVDIARREGITLPPHVLKQQEKFID